jgi:NTP pyrophosphatase (non-canonical NTP hydrolase)
MNFDDYQAAASRTANGKLTDQERLLDAAAGLAEEAGEILGLVRKHVFQGHPLAVDKLRSELGDALWCLAMAAHSVGARLDEVADGNIAKLRARYPDGYTDSASRERRL